MPFEFPDEDTIMDAISDVIDEIRTAQSMLEGEEKNLAFESSKTSILIGINTVFASANDESYWDDIHDLYAFTLNPTTGTIRVAHTHERLLYGTAHEPFTMDDLSDTTRAELSPEGQRLYDIVEGLKRRVDEDPSSSNNGSNNAFESPEPQEPQELQEPVSFVSAPRVSNTTSATNGNPSNLNNKGGRRTRSKRKRSSRRRSRKHRRRS